jgi:hypothetical protein
MVVTVVLGTLLFASPIRCCFTLPSWPGEDPAIQVCSQSATPTLGLPGLAAARRPGNDGKEIESFSGR